MQKLAARTLTAAESLIDLRAIDEFTATLTRPPILPGAPDYDEARRVFNALIDKRPALIVRCRGVADVTRSLRFAREHDLLVAVAAEPITLPDSPHATVAS
jgi:hypothetical protein